MITEQDLNQAIEECENSPNPNANTCMKLASYYVIKDKMYPQEQRRQEPMYYSGSADPGTEFTRLAAGISQQDLINIMNELMETVEILSPKLYDAIIEKLKKA